MLAQVLIVTAFFFGAALGVLAIAAALAGGPES